MKGSPRYNFILFVLFFLAGVIGARLFYLQIWKGDYYRAQAMGQQVVGENIRGERGEIMAHDGPELMTLVANKPEYFCYAVPKDIKDRKMALAQAAEFFGIGETELDAKTQNLDNQYVPIKIKMDKDEADRFKALNLSGFYVGQKTITHYLRDNLASNILGYVDSEGHGQYGIQAKFDDCLRGKEDFIEKEKGIFGYFSASSNSDLKGCNIILTIDVNIQKKAEELLQKAKSDFNIEAGQIIVLEPQTGKIMAMAQYPQFNPNEYSKYAKDFKIFQNGAVQGLYEPGSVFKAVTMTIGLNEGKITPETTFVDQGFVKIGDANIKNYGNRTWGRRTMTEVLERSINTGVVFVKQQMSNRKLLDYFEKYGLFEPTKIDMFGEVYDRNEELRKARDVNLATASYGQGVSMTPLRLAVTYGVIANGGKLMRPYVVDKIIYPDGTIKEIKPIIEQENVISEESARQVRIMLNSVTENGYSQAARVQGYFVGGKTGTAQMPKPGGGYSMDTWHTFAGIAPIFKPRFVAIIKLDKPQAGEASVSAAPMFHELAKYIFQYLKIPTDRDPNEVLKYKTIK